MTSDLILEITGTEANSVKWVLDPILQPDVLTSHVEFCRTSLLFMVCKDPNYEKNCFLPPLSSSKVDVLKKHKKGFLLYTLFLQWSAMIIILSCDLVLPWDTSESKSVKSMAHLIHVDFVPDNYLTTGVFSCQQIVRVSTLLDNPWTCQLSMPQLRGFFLCSTVTLFSWRWLSDVKFNYISFNSTLAFCTVELQVSNHWHHLDGTFLSEDQGEPIWCLTDHLLNFSETLVFLLRTFRLPVLM